MHGIIFQIYHFTACIAKILTKKKTNKLTLEL